MLPKDDDRKRKQKKQPDNSHVAKKLRQEEPVVVSGLDLTETWINDRLLPIVATQIIMETLVHFIILCFFGLILQNHFFFFLICKFEWPFIVKIL